MASQQPFDLVFLPAYPRRLIPVNLSDMRGAIREPNFRGALPLAPTTLTIQLPKTRNLEDPRPNRKRLNLREWAEQLEMHSAMFPKS